jgi:hypothetical protein
LTDWLLLLLTHFNLMMLVDCVVLLGLLLLLCLGFVVRRVL